jgi:calcineurin-like phosphoesterase family protein
MIWLTSDLHFFHYLPALGRPFQDARMDTLLIDNWNFRISPKDEVWVLGDFSLHASTEQMKGVFDQLNGSKHLVRGNHDHGNKVHKLKWASIHDTHMLHFNGSMFWLSHYAHRTWPSKGHGVIHCYGHSHGHLPDFQRSTDVGVDNPEWNYSPVSTETLIAKFKDVKFGWEYE